jgi:integration host factor subunit alpha
MDDPWTKTTTQTLTREDLRAAIRKDLPTLSLDEAKKLVDETFEEIIAGLHTDGKVQLSGFGSFIIRHKSERIGRNPKNGVEAPITARRTVSFKPSPVLKAKINT